MSALKPLIAEIESTEFDASNLQVEKLRGWERISQLFWFELTVVCRNAVKHGEAESDLPSVGASLTIVLRRDDAAGRETQTRRIHGVLQSVKDRLGTDRNHRTLVLRVVPQITTLNLVSIQEIFLESNAQQIITQKLDLHGIAGPRLEFHIDTPPVRDFVVQYKETDLAFVSRVAENLGISFIFVHDEKGPERIVFTDDVARRGIQQQLDLVFRSEGEHEDVYALEIDRQMYPSVFVVEDYNYRHPLADISATHKLETPEGEPLGNGGGIVEYGSHHKTSDEGAKLARIRAEEAQSAADVYTGKSNVFALTAGITGTLTGHPMLDDTELLIVEVQHNAEFVTGDGSSNVAGGYENTFKAISTAVRFRPPRVTPRPRIHGLVTGIVSPSANVGGRAELDDEGRYIVQLHFDSVDPKEKQRTSHPIRMSQPFAGPNHGFHFPLRPGTEVVVAFMDGDPDRPVIVGSVPNATARSATTAKNANESRIQSATGIILQFSENK